MSHSAQPSEPPSNRERARRERIARRHELGRPDVTEIEVGQRTYAVAEVEPLDVDGVRTVTIGTALWLVAFVALLPFVGPLRDAGQIWWLWTCLAGFGLGLIGIEYCRRRRQALQLQPGLRRNDTSQFGAAGS
ncbi:DUF2530 domain-containing protein [Solicola gregarius]|uniref:DUF2530 domain-containing protein n=1 Tax=Solicola gregarius TaxID=2908642 RepID=A0AA46YNH2_9ACTN|nr:DUF2530 domain-containing protein [Solicola gregarius]UYM06703.1 DUF2530 domain-containing protein [Solicola gregarius]